MKLIPMAAIESLPPAPQGPGERGGGGGALSGYLGAGEADAEKRTVCVHNLEVSGDLLVIPLQSEAVGFGGGGLRGGEDGVLGSQAFQVQESVLHFPAGPR